MPGMGDMSSTMGRADSGMPMPNARSSVVGAGSAQARAAGSSRPGVRMRSAQVMPHGSPGPQGCGAAALRGISPRVHICRGDLAEAGPVSGREPVDGRALAL